MLRSDNNEGAEMQVCPRCGFREALTVAEAAEKLGVSGQTVRNWIKAGKLPAVETNGDGMVRLWVPIEALKADDVKRLAKASRALGTLAKAGRAKAAAAK